MELLCIQSHSMGVVKAGNIYPLIRSFVWQCGCNTYDVGIARYDDFRLIPVGYYITCGRCKASMPKLAIHNETWWISETRFAKIGEIDELEAYEEKLLINK